MSMKRFIKRKKSSGQTSQVQGELETIPLWHFSFASPR